MIQLTENIIAVEVPNDATDIELNEGAFLVFLSYKIGIESYLKDLELKPNNHALIGVTPLSYEDWCIQVFFNEYDNGNITHGDDISILLESKGLDINKKYAIIKIESDYFLYLLTIESPINRVITSIIN